MKTAIVNNREGLEIGQLPSTMKDASGRPLLAGIVTLLPGLNLIDSEAVNTLRKNPGFEAKFTTKIEPGMAPEHALERTGSPILELVHFDKKVDGKVVKVPVDNLDDELPLAKLTDEQCKILVEQVLVGETLRSWGKAEARPSVRLIIEKQIEKIGSAPGNPATAGR
jgi:hypothetical protein